MISCSRKTAQTSDNLTDFTVRLAKKAKEKKVEKEIQYWSSEKARLSLITNVNDFDVDEDGVIIETAGTKKKVFNIDKITPGELAYIKSGIYWIKFSKDDSRLVPFKRTCNDNSCIFSLAVQSNNNEEVRLSDGKKYLVRGNPHLKVTREFANDNSKEVKTATGVKVNGED